ncbi:Endonuclease/Exonuclease/phosphatase family protein [Rubripirellula lacrimiformis]|uniref:Endonuclease/Exonuclease/phosphatase family protein n=1 Tax=Rubripirellula lacrimiformis TaxID=1930273 RepID=A0A517NAG0_9BACT|nr:endonuclease/exonuclease/phosphatase family protein [Rubripirellula lacrimiformis]QDT04119.1 Endonuclease/Exonuclease/phosphatase family protein [Rubripirellula lacrimiformis]
MPHRIASSAARLSAFALLVLSVFSSAAPAQTNSGADSNQAAPFEVMTFNIRYLNNNDGQDVWANRSDTVISTISKADVVGLQEVVKDQLDAVKAGTEGFQWYGLGRDDGKTGGESAPIGFRRDRFKAIDQGTLWLSETPDVAGSKGWDAALPRTVTWMLLEDRANANRWYILNTHFDHRGSQARENSGKGIASLVDKKSGDVPVVVMGDFNATDDSQPLKNLRSGTVAPLRSARTQTITPASGPTGTWNGFKAIQDGRRIDHVLVTDQVQVLSHTTLDPKTPEGRFASDHLPIVVEVTLNAAAKPAK